VHPNNRETVLQIQENMYMQYFIGYSPFSDEEHFDASLFVDIRKRLVLVVVNSASNDLYYQNNGSGVFTLTTSPITDWG
jgi:hypothetical protein